MVKIGFKVIAMFGIFMAFWCIFVALILPEIPIIMRIILPAFSGLLLYFSGKLWYREQLEYGW